MLKENIKSRLNKNGRTNNSFDILSYQARELEANEVFPRIPKSIYKSSDFADSFEFPFNPDPLASGNNYDIYDEMKRDDQIKAAMNIKKDIILSTGWSIECENEEISDTLEINFSEKMESSFEDSLKDILSSFEYGFSMTEPIYRRNSTGQIELKDLKTRPPHSFRFNVDDFGIVKKITQQGALGDKQFKPNYFLHYIYQPEFGNPFGQSDLRSAHEPWVMKKFFRRMWAIYVERFASPTVVGKAPADAGPEERTKIFNMLKTIQNSTVTVVPDGTTIEFLENKRDSSDIYSTSIEKLNVMMARAILLPDMLGMSGGQTSGGSFALGKTHFQMFLNMIKKEQEILARKITLKIIRPMVLANWGDVPCNFKFNSFSEDNTGEHLKMWVEAVKGKIYKPTDEEINHFKELTEFPITDDPIERPEPAANPFDPNNGPPQNGKPDVPRGTDDQEKPDNETEDDNEGARESDFSEEVITFREKTSFEKKIDFVEVRKKLDISEQRVTRPIRSSAKEISNNLIDQIKRKNIFGNRFKPGAFNEIKPKFQREMNVAFKRHFKGLYKDAFNMAQKEIFPEKETKFQEVGEELLPEEFLKIIEAESFKIVGDYSVLITNKAKNILTEGIKSGLNERDVLKRVREVVNTETDKWLKTVIRTKSTEFFNRGRKSFFDNDPEASQIIEAFQFSAIIDDRTSDVCQSLDGKIFNKGEFTQTIVPPLHFNCRSLLVPVTKFEDFTVSKEVPKDELRGLGGNLVV